MAELKNYQLQEMLDQITYRPNVKMRLVEWGYPGNVSLRLFYDVEDTYNPGRPLLVQHQYQLPPWFADKEHFVAFVRQCIEKTEVHEAMEWLKWKDTGRPIFDPHAAEVEQIMEGT